MSRMPKLDIDKVPAEYRSLVARIIAGQGKNKGCLRASKPPVPKKVQVENSDSLWGYTFRFASEEDAKAGDAAYIWRMVAFYCSPIHQHHCMPITSDWDLDGTASEARARAAELDQIVDIVMEQVPSHKRYGLLRWSRVL